MKLVCISLLALGLLTAQAQYSIDWFTIDGGGGTSTGSVYSISGTIGQPDAGKMTGGTYTLNGGFWGTIAAVQTPGAPLLTITRSNNFAIVPGRTMRQVSVWKITATFPLQMAGQPRRNHAPPMLELFPSPSQLRRAITSTG